MTEIYPPVAVAPAAAVASAQKQARALLFAATFLERFCVDSMRSILTMQLVAVLAIGRAEAASLLALYFITNTLLLVPGGWVADAWWGTRRTLLIGAGLVLLTYLLLALLSGFHFELSQAGLPPVAVLSGLLILLGAGSSLLAPSLLVAIGNVSTQEVQSLTNFLLARLVGGLAGILFPLMVGSVSAGYGLGGVALIISAAALALLLVLLQWGRLASGTRIAGVGPRSMPGFVKPVVLALLSLAATILPYLLRGMVGLPGLGLGIFAISLGYLAWQLARSPQQQGRSYYLPALIAAVFILSVVLELAIGLGYGPAATPAQQALWGGTSLLTILALYFGARQSSSAGVERRFTFGGLGLAGLGIGAVAGPVLLHMGPYLDGGTATVLGLPPALLLHAAVAWLLFMLPVMISQHAPVRVQTRLMALALMGSIVAYNLADAAVSYWLNQ
ncbi:hypothetical protein [Hymenobacter lucidus]|uniref:MFS transporter n=1 Tax=Hymenobacter lucidus TaxID=2880930 RepID=A0ABS8AYG1_9BACT|nr:hypothetical protein [Hymenobacter lucidus]MCB2410855.1 hypothetical protein [Hymenobacter lucidus]